jgi:hypothetical protein
MTVYLVDSSVAGELDGTAAAAWETAPINPQHEQGLACAAGLRTS